jgi:hypothetical protein
VTHDEPNARHSAAHVFGLGVVNVADEIEIPVQLPWELPEINGEGVVHSIDEDHPII